MIVRETKIKYLFWILLLAISLIVLVQPEAVYAQEGLQKMVNSLEQAEQGMTLWQTIKAGGFIMFVLAGLSVIAGAIVVYNFMNLKINTLTPQDKIDELLKKLTHAKDSSIIEYCQANKNVPSNIALEGIKAKKRGFLFAREAMENCAKREVSRMWQNISYLADLAAIAPLVGLLGTVIGMIQAFNVIAFQTAAVKPILLAGGVSKAMVTTAGGLIVAIPIMLFYTFFRGKVHDISNIVETSATDIIKIMEETEASNV